MRLRYVGRIADDELRPESGDRLARIVRPEIRAIESGPARQRELPCISSRSLDSMLVYIQPEKTASPLEPEQVHSDETAPRRQLHYAKWID